MEKNEYSLNINDLAGAVPVLGMVEGGGSAFQQALQHRLKGRYLVAVIRHRFGALSSTFAELSPVPHLPLLNGMALIGNRENSSNHQADAGIRYTAAADRSRAYTNR